MATGHAVDNRILALGMSPRSPDDDGTGTNDVGYHRRIPRNTIRTVRLVFTCVAAAAALLVVARPASAVENPTVDGTFEGEGSLGPGQSMTVAVLGRGGVPSTGVGAVVLNVTATKASLATHLAVGFSSSGGVGFSFGNAPTTSNLNVPAGSTVSNMVIADVAVEEAVNIYNHQGFVEVVVDVLGWFPIGTFEWTPTSRLMDTRSIDRATIDTVAAGAGAFGGTMDLRVVGRAGVPPSGVGAVALNITATEPSAASHLTVWPSGTPKPTASNVNMAAGQTVPNMVIAAPGANGRISIDNHAGSSHVLVDVMGWFPVGTVRPLQPARLLDTRGGLPTVDGREGGRGPVNGEVTLPVAGRGGVPTAGVEAVILNVTAVSPTAASFVTVWPSGTARPTASNLNPSPGSTTPNLVISKLGADGAISLFNSLGTTDLVVDVAGWIGTGQYHGLVPARVLDTRRDSGVPFRPRSIARSSRSRQATDPYYYMPHFAPGTMLVGDTIVAGRYMTDEAGVGCTFTRLGAGGDQVATETRDFAGRLIVDVHATDTALIITDACGVIRGPTSTPAPPTSGPPLPPGGGVSTIVLQTVGDHLVGAHVSPSTYRSVTTGPGCLWARLSGFGGEVDDLIEGAIEPAGRTIEVTIAPTDVGFYTTPACGTWQSNLLVLPPLPIGF